MTLFVSCFILKSKWCGWETLPPGFLFPVKEQTFPILSSRSRTHKGSFFVGFQILIFQSASTSKEMIYNL